MTDTIEIRQNMETLKELHISLVDLCAQQNPAFMGFEIEKVTVDMEKHVLRDGVESLDVSTLEDWTHMHRVLNGWGSYYKAQGFSTKFVDRLPGFVVITQNQKDIKALIHEINRYKDAIAKDVRKNRDSYERHKFIHDTFSSIMTEQVYRHIHYFEKEVTNVWFNWASRPVPKSFTIKEALAMLKEQKKRPKYMMSHKEWETMIEKIESNIKTGGFSSIQQMREFRVLPTIELQYIETLDTKKRTKKNATTPIILLGQEKNVLPTFSALSPYQKNTTDKKMKLSANKTMINPYLRLVGVKAIKKK